MLKRLAPVCVLFVLSPLIAEYLSGSMAMAQITLLPFMMLLYGGGAVLVREAVRHTRRGWASIALLGLAYGLLEEGLFDQSLFNPHFVGLHLLDYGHWAPLGIGIPWTLYVLGIHVVWSIMVPVAVVELLFQEQRTTPWLRGPGLAVTALLYAAGAAMVTFGTAHQEHFMASPLQLGVAGAAALAAIVLAFALPAPHPTEGKVTAPWIAGLLSFAACSAAVLTYGQGANTLHWPWPVVAAGIGGCAVAMLAFGAVVTRRSSWNNRHRFAMTAGALLVYCWFGFMIEISLHKTTNLLPHAALATAMLILLAITGWRVRDAR